MPGSSKSGARPRPKNIGGGLIARIEKKAGKKPAAQLWGPFFGARGKRGFFEIMRRTRRRLDPTGLSPGAKSHPWPPPRMPPPAPNAPSFFLNSAPFPKQRAQNAPDSRQDRPPPTPRPPGARVRRIYNPLSIPTTSRGRPRVGGPRIGPPRGAEILPRRGRHPFPSLPPLKPAPPRGLAWSDAPKFRENSKTEGRKKQKPSKGKKA